MWRKLLTSVFLVVFLLATAADVLFATSVPVDLGKARNYGVLGLKNTTVKLNSATVNGNVGVGTGGELDFESYSVNGDIFIDSIATIFKFTGKHNGNLYLNQDLSEALLDAADASHDAAALSPTKTFATINSTTIISGNGGLNVINIGTLDLNNEHETLTLKGNANDIFILNILASGDFKLRKTTTAIKGEGIKPSQILINVLGRPGEVKGQIDGTILASGWDFKLQNILNGAIIAGNVEVSSAILEVKATVNNANNINSFVPEPATVLLVGLGALVFIRKHGTQE